jgi:hypothetical protein
MQAVSQIAPRTARDVASVVTQKCHSTTETDLIISIILLFVSRWLLHLQLVIDGVELFGGSCSNENDVN